MSKADETKQYIIEKAAAIFNRHGYEGTSMSQLTAAIGKTKGAIYGNFKNKDEIAHAAFEHNLALVENQITSIVSSRKHTCDKLIAFAGYYLDHFHSLLQKGGCPILNAAVDSDNSDLPIRASVMRAVDNWLDSVTRIVNSGKRKEEIKAQVDADEFASLFVSSIEGGILLSKVTGDQAHLERVVNNLIDLVNNELRR